MTQMDDLRERAEEIADCAVGERHNANMYQRVTEIALKELRAAVEAEREACAKLCDEDDYVDGHGFAAAIRRRIDEFQELIEGLQKWRDEDHQDNIVLARHHVIVLLEGLRAAVEAERAPLIEALQPFALAADLIECTSDHKYSDDGDWDVKIGDLRKARAAIHRRADNG